MEQLSVKQEYIHLTISLACKRKNLYEARMLSLVSLFNNLQKIENGKVCRKMFLSSSSLIPVNKNKSFCPPSLIFQVITHQPKPLAQLYHNMKPAHQLQLFTSPPTSNLFSATTSQHILLSVLPSYLPQLTPHPPTTFTFQTMKRYLPVI